MPYFGQELFELAEAKGPLTDAAYLAALAENQRLARAEGIDAVMDAYRLDALVMPTGGPAWKIDLLDGDHHMGGSSQPAALAGYPAITVPAGAAFGLPVRLTFMGRAYPEPPLIPLPLPLQQPPPPPPPPQYPP